MPGLLDFLQSPEAQLGIGLLAAAGPTPQPMSFGQRLAMVTQGLAQQRDQELRRKLIDSQIEENANQNLYRAAQVKKLNDDAAFEKSLSERLSRMGVPSPATGGAGMPEGVAPSPTGNVGGSGVGGFPLTFGETVIAGLKGKNLMDAYKYWNEPQELKAGSIYRNRFTGATESIPTTTASGQATQVIPAPGMPGGFQVIVPEGAANAYRKFKEIDADVSAGNSLTKVYNPRTGREEYQTNAQIRNAATGGGYGTEGDMRQRIAEGDGDTPQSIIKEIAAATADKKKVSDPRSIAALDQHIESLNRRLGSLREGGAMPAGPSLDESNAAAGRKAFEENLGKAASDNVAASQAGAQSALQTLQNVELMKRGLGEAILGPGANARVSLARIGQVMGVSGADATEQLANTRALMQGLSRQELSAAGQMKGQGQITESERAILRKAESGDIAELTSVELRTLIGILERSARTRLQSHNELMGRVQGGASPSQLMSVNAPAPVQPNAPAAMNALPTANASNRGRRIRDTATGKVFISNGMQWKEE